MEHVVAHPAQTDTDSSLSSLASPALWRHARPSRWNPWLIALTGLAGLWQWFGLGLALRHWGATAAFTLLPVLLLTPMHWGLIHESIHGQLRLKPRDNERTGRLLSVLLGLPFEIMRFGHLLHHRFTRQPFDRPDISTLADSAPPLARLRAWFGYQSRLLGGMWLAEIFAPVIAWIPPRRLPALAARALGTDGQDEDVRRRVVMFGSDPVRRRRIQRDFVMTLVALALAIWAYGPWWPVFVAAFAARGIWLSIADNLPHYASLAARCRPAKPSADTDRRVAIPHKSAGLATARYTPLPPNHDRASLFPHPVLECFRICSKHDINANRFR